MSLRDYVMRFLGYAQSSRRVFYFDDELVQSLRSLAAVERRTEDEVAADLLSFALAQRGAAEKNLQRWRALTPREQEVVALTCLDYTNRQIASRLTISPETVKTHIRNAQLKFGMRSKAELRQVLADWDFSGWDGGENQLDLRR
jgi:DNA-binding CsgD family transcriptional regulator